MGLGKTIQVLALLLHLRERRDRGASETPPNLLVLPASLIANWQSEISRFAPPLRTFVAHPSETAIDLQDARALDAALKDADLVITTYAMLARLLSLRARRWGLVILDDLAAGDQKRRGAADALRQGASIDGANCPDRHTD